MIKVLVVCLGNLCRSPTAHGVLVQQIHMAGLSDQVVIDSAGTSGWHHNEPPDHRSVAVAAERGYDLSYIRSRKVQPDDFVDQDLILAMDYSNLEALSQQCPSQFRHKLRLFLDFLATHGSTGNDEREVPDPYYGGSDGFNHVIDLVEAGSQALIQHLQDHFITDSPSAS